MLIEETLEYRSYLCLARICGALGTDNLGSYADFDDADYYEAHFTELFGADIDRVFHSQHIAGAFGSQRWAFTDPANDLGGDDLRARLFYDRDYDLYYLVHSPTKTFDDKINDVMTAIGAGIPDQFLQAAQLLDMVRPEYRDKVVMSGFSLGGALAAYAAIKGPWPVRTIVFDPLGLNRNMMGEDGSGFFGQGEVLSDRFRHMNDHLDWFYIAHSWVARTNIERHLSSVGRVNRLPQDPIRAVNNPDTHDFRHVGFGLRRLWDKAGWRGSGVFVGESGVFASDEVVRAADWQPWNIRTALETAAAPIAVEYFPVGESEVTKYSTVPVDAMARVALVSMVKVINPSRPTLFRVVLPDGAELAKAVGGGFRGFTKGAGGTISAQAVLVPVGVGGALKKGWPALALAGTVTALNMYFQREQRAHQAKVEALLERMEERDYRQSLRGQRSADAQLTRVISLVLDGDDPPLELALKSADDEFHSARLWLEMYDGVVGGLVGADGKVAYKRLREALGWRKDGGESGFFRELHLARAAIAIKHKALIVDAAARALADPSNPYSAFRGFLESQARQLEHAERMAADLTDSLSSIRIRGGWPEPPRKVWEQEHRIQDMASSPAVDPGITVEFLLTPSGEIVRVLQSPDDAAGAV